MKLSIAEMEGIAWDLERQRQDSLARMELMMELYPGWIDEHPSLANALLDLNSSMIAAVNVFAKCADEQRIAGLLASVGCTMPRGAR